MQTAGKCSSRSSSMDNVQRRSRQDSPGSRHSNGGIQAKRSISNINKAMESRLYSVSGDRMEKIDSLDSDNAEDNLDVRTSNALTRLKTLEEVATTRLQFTSSLRYRDDMYQVASNQENVAIEHDLSPNNVGVLASIVQAVRPFPFVSRIMQNKGGRVLTMLSLVVTGVAWIVSVACQRMFEEIRSITMNCPKCHGYGITQCQMCNGTGVHIYELKFQHVDPCPECSGKRFQPCSCCGGKYHRSIFAHNTYQFKVAERPPTLTSRFED